MLQPPATFGKLRHHEAIVSTLDFHSVQSYLNFGELSLQEAEYRALEEDRWPR